MEESLEELGKRGYEEQVQGSYYEAIELYTTAIKKYPNDARLYNNRCLCYMDIKDYKAAKDDAEKMVLKFPAYKNSYIRKAEILIKLERFKEAEELFKVVLNLDPTCEYAKVEALEAQVSQICKGLEFSRKEGRLALEYTGSVEDARAALISGQLRLNFKDTEDVVYVSGDDDDDPSEESKGFVSVKDARAALKDLDDVIYISGDDDDDDDHHHHHHHPPQQFEGV